MKPTVGRTVHYWPTVKDDMPHTEGQPLAALVAGVNEDGSVNLAVFDNTGQSHSRVDVLFVSDGYEGPMPVAGHAAWPVIVTA